MDKLPFMKMFPTDWRADHGLQLCSLAARGLWIEMLFLMHDHGGYLTITDEDPLSEHQLARMVRSDRVEVIELLAELEAAKVFSRDERGWIYSRRIVRDLERSQLNRVNGAKGGNPALVKTDKPPPNRPVNGEDKPRARASQSPESRVQKESSSDAPAHDAPAHTHTREGTTTTNIVSYQDLAAARFRGRHLQRVLRNAAKAHDPAAYVESIPPDAEPPPTAAGRAVAGMIFVPEGSAPWIAWAATRAAPWPKTTCNGNVGRWFPTEYPERQEAAS